MVINHSIAPTYVIDDMFDWLNADKSNFLFSERISMAADLYKFSNLSNFAYTNVVSGFTEQAKQRMIGKVLNTIATVLSK